MFHLFENISKSHSWRWVFLSMHSVLAVSILCSYSSYSILFWLLLLWKICNPSNCHSFTDTCCFIIAIFRIFRICFAHCIWVCLEVDFFLFIMVGIHQAIESEDWSLAKILENFWPFSPPILSSVFFLCGTCMEVYSVFLLYPLCLLTCHISFFIFHIFHFFIFLCCVIDT